MVKNVRSSTSSSHLSPLNTTAALSNTQIRARISQFATDLDTLGAKVHQNVVWRDVISDSQDGGQARTSSNGSGHADGNGKVAPLYMIDEPIVPQRTPGQSISYVKSSKPRSEALSFSLTTRDDGMRPELGMERADAKPKSLFEGSCEQALTGHEQALELMNTMEKSLFRTQREELYLRRELEREILITNEIEKEEAVKAFSLKSPEEYTQPFCDFLTENPTVFHAVDYFENQLVKAGYSKVCLLHLPLYSAPPWIRLTPYSSLNAKNGTSSQGGNTLSLETALL